MPRLDNRINEQGIPYEMRLVLAMLLAEVNLIRQEAGLPLRTAAQLRAAVRTWVKDHPRGEV